MDDRDTARLLALARVLVGAGLMLMPRFAARMWLGRETADFPTKMMVRGLGARDLGLGVGTLLALDGDEAATWLQASALADATDAMGTLGSWSELPGLRRLLLLGAEAGATYLNLRAANALD